MRNRCVMLGDVVNFILLRIYFDSEYQQQGKEPSRSLLAAP